MAFGVFRIALMLACASAVVLAQGLPVVEVFSGFSHARIPGEAGGLSLAHLNGWDAAVKLNFRPRIGWVLDIGGSYGERRMVPNGFQTRETFPGAVRQHTVLFGPEVKAFAGERFTVNLRALIGVAYDSGLTLPLKEPFVPGPPDPRPLVAEFSVGPSKSFAGAVGGSLDYRLTDHVSLRLIQPELLVVSLGSTNLQRMRISAGVVFTFGAW